MYKLEKQIPLKYFYNFIQIWVEKINKPLISH